MNSAINQNPDGQDKKISMLDRSPSSRKSVGMKINTASITAQFTDYARSFYTDDPFIHENIVLKEEHTHRVCEFAMRIASSTGLDAHEKALAYLSALLHDAGRFEQFTRYKTFRDALSEDHGLLGIRVIAEQSFLKDLSDDDKNIVREAVRNHNRISVDETLDKRTTFHAKILRDSDKLDIIALHLDYFGQRKHSPRPGLESSFSDTPGYSSEIVDLIMQSAPVPHSFRKNYTDFILVQLGWLLDLNFPFSYRYAREHDYVGKILAYLPDDDCIKKAGSYVLAEVTRRENVSFTLTCS
jgi:hypothetical protein